MANLPDVTMKALCFYAPGKFKVQSIATPEIRDDEVLIRVSLCGVCGSDLHLTAGEWLTTFPLTPGHEVVGSIEKVGKSVKGFAQGDRCVADPLVSCDNCFFCRRGNSILCENFLVRGCSLPGGCAEYIVFPSKKVFKIHNLTDEEATLVEPTSCAIHGMDMLGATVGVEALVLGAGPSGLVLAQLLRLNGASRVVIAANKGRKTEIAQDLNVADEYIELERENPAHQWEQLKRDNPYGFDVVVEATGSEEIANEAINYVRRGGTLMLYSLYHHTSLVHWHPSKIFTDEIKIIGSIAQSHCFPRAVAYIDSGKVRVKGMVTDIFTIDEYSKVLETMKNKSACKVAVKPA